MIKFERTEVSGWEAAVRGMRNPKNSWAKSDSDYEVVVNGADRDVVLGPNDHKLMMTLRNAGTDHRKFMRFITVTVDITAPLYWWAEFDTYKVGTVRDSCSFMHKGTSRPYYITDFSIHNEAVYDILSDLEKKTYTLHYPYDTDEYVRWFDINKRSYRVYRNGKVVREEFAFTDMMGRTKTYPEKEATIYQSNTSGYFVVKLSGKNVGHIMLHRLVAECFLDKKVGAYQVNHIDGNKGNNSVENLEWVSPSENVQKAVKLGLYDNLGSLHSKYLKWKNSSTVIPCDRRSEFYLDVAKGLTHNELAEKYGITPSQANNARWVMSTSENETLFQECYAWEQIVSYLNLYRAMAIETGDAETFQALRCLMPQGYMQKATVLLNYEVLANIYKSRKNHKLDEWSIGFMDWIRNLPYSELITGEEKSNE